MYEVQTIEIFCAPNFFRMSRVVSVFIKCHFFVVGFIQYISKQYIHITMATQLAMQQNPEEVHRQQTAAGMQMGGEEEQMEVGRL